MRCIPWLLMSAVLPAAELPDGLQIGGWGEAFARAESRAANNPKHSLTHALGETDNSLDFAAGAAVKGLYTVERFQLRIDVVINDQPQFASSDSPVLLEQAFIDFHQTDHITWRAGRFQTTWIGWEGFHTAELLRVNHSAAWDWNVQNHSLKPNKPFLSDGAGLLLATADDQHHAEFYVVNDLLGDGNDTSGTDKAAGASFWSRVPDFGKIELGLGYDPRSVNSGAGKPDSNAFAVDLNADVITWQASGWRLAFEAQFHNHPQLTIGTERYGNDLVLLAAANYAFADDLSGTIMLDYVERGFATADNEVLETAIALLCRPHRQVRFNSELFYWKESADRADSFGLGAVLNISFP